MPTIFKPKKKTNINDGKRKERQKCYNTSTWRKMRMQYIREHPTSEISEWEGKVALTEHIHHVRSFLNVPLEQRDMVAFDYNNLIAVTQQEHSRLHNGDLRGCETKEEIRAKVESLIMKKVDG